MPTQAPMPRCRVLAFSSSSVPFFFLLSARLRAVVDGPAAAAEISSNYVTGGGQAKSAASHEGSSVVTVQAIRCRDPVWEESLQGLLPRSPHRNCGLPILLLPPHRSKSSTQPSPVHQSGLGPQHPSLFSCFGCLTLYGQRLKADRFG